MLLPLQFNDAREVPAEWLADAVLEVVDPMAIRAEAEAWLKKAVCSGLTSAWAGNLPKATPNAASTLRA